MTNDPKSTEDYEFFVGYAPRLTQPLRRFLISVVALVVLGYVALAIGLPSLHAPTEKARYQGLPNDRPLEGVLVDQPVASILVSRVGQTGQHPEVSRYPLIGLSKSGPRPQVLEQMGKLVALDGILVFRDGEVIVAPRSAQPVETEVPLESPTAGVDLGVFTLQGEIVESKCFFGVMKPGHTKTHRMCAARCISGGVPPVLLVREGEATMYFLLRGEDGAAINQQVLEYLAEPVQIRGSVFQYDDLFVLRADPSQFRRIS